MVRFIKRLNYLIESFYVKGNQVISNQKKKTPSSNHH